MAKLRRVRTGCLTCRDRHLKCDEAVPDCANCRKGNRLCRRGLRISFLDVKVHTPYVLASCIEVEDTDVTFCDESRLIASEYAGGLQRYAAAREIAPRRESPDASSYRNPPSFPDTQRCYYESNKRERSYVSRQSVEQIDKDVASTEQPSNCGHGLVHASRYSVEEVAEQHLASLSGGFKTSHMIYHKLLRPTNSQREWQRSQSTKYPSLAQEPQPGKYCSTESGDKPCTDFIPRQSDFRFYQLRERPMSQEDLSFVRAFIDNVAAWMDTVAPEDAFSQILPVGYTFNSSALLNAVLACGAKSIVQQQPELETKAAWFYKTAATQLAHNLNDITPNNVEYTKTTTLLHVYEMMTSRDSLCFMKLINKSRTLFQKPGPLVQTTGIIRGCFWVFVCLDIFVCLKMNWEITLKPDDWCLNNEWTADETVTATESRIWVHRAMYMLAKVVDFKARAQPFLPSDPHQDQAKLGLRLTEWQSLKQLCDDWNELCPGFMRPVAFLGVEQSNSPSESVFPKFWLPQTSAMLGRVMYHTAHCILLQTNPLGSSGQPDDEMKPLQLHHARQVLGLVGSGEYHESMAICVPAAMVAVSILEEPHERREAQDILERLDPRGSFAAFQGYPGEYS